VPREDICYVSWTIDSYDGLGFLSTDDPKRGLVSVFVSSDYSHELESLLEALRSEGVALRNIECQPDAAR
jgi:hypothetical protein